MGKQPATLIALAALLAVAVSVETVEVWTTRLPLCPAEPERRQVGGLEYRGGVRLSSPDGRFGGLSALRVSADGRRVVMVTDRGDWVSAGLVVDERGFLTGVESVEIGRLQDLEGRVLEGKRASDAEALAILPDGAFVVGFERESRLWSYGAKDGRPSGRAVSRPAPPELRDAPANGGVEALVSLADGRLFALAEDWVEAGAVRAWIEGPTGWERLSYPVHGDFRPTDAARLPGGDLVVLERAYTVTRGLTGARLRRLDSSSLSAGARLEGEILAEIAPPLLLDNYEGVEAGLGPAGETLLYLVSDDNFSPSQRTLLLKFALTRPR